MTVGSLFAGIGGFDRGLERAGFNITWQVENNDYCRQVLNKHWPSVPCHYDITTIDWHFIPHVDLVCGGFPCQPFSCAGKRRGKDDDRYLWPEVVRCLTVLRPAWFLGENVPGLLHLGIDQVLVDLEALGYQTAVCGIPACAVDAPHIRQRLWIVAYTSSERRQQIPGSAYGDEGENEGRATLQADESASDGQDVAYATSARCRTGQRSASEPVRNEARRSQLERRSSDVADAGRLPTRRSAERREEKGGGSYREPPRLSRWLPEPTVGRVAHGVPNRVDRLRGLGNAIVPQIAEALGTIILEVDRLEGTTR